MSQTSEPEKSVHVTASNIGGIDETEVSLSPGVNVLSGQNATNRTSFLRAVMAALGSTNASLKADADSGSVEVDLGSDTHTRRLERSNGRIEYGGDPYLDDPELADLYAFLLEDNEARQAVARNGRDLRSVIMEPIDTAAIQAEIQQYEARKRQLDERLSELDALENDRPNLQENATRIDGQIEDKEEQLESIREEIAEAEADVEETRQIKAELESKLDDLQDVRSEYETVSERLDTERDSLSAVREERETLEETLADLPESVEAERGKINSRMSDFRSKISTLESEISELQNLIQFNQALLDGEVTLLSELRAAEDTGDITAQLVDQDSISCWTCGSEVERGQIEATVDRLRVMREKKLDRVTEFDEEIEALNDRKSDLDAQRDKRQRVEARLTDLEDEIADRTDSIEELEERHDELAGEIERLETEIESLEFAEDHSELLSLHQEANRLELEIERLESDREEVEADIRDLEDRLAQREELETDREEVADALTELRTRIERIETEAVEEFNDRMDDVLGIMEYDNIERIWIERKEGADVRSGSDADVEFALHVIRSGESGAAYEDSVEHLSESEREVTGLIFALAGYLVHDVYEIVPFMVLDSLEALDGNRIARLVEYFKSQAEYLVVALLEEDARGLDDAYTRVRDI